jgi:TolA-binding protein
MAHTKLVIALLVAAPLTVGCSSTAGKPAAGQEDQGTPRSQSGEAHQQATNPRPAEGYPYAQKTQFAQDMRLELARLERAIDRLSSRVESTSGSVQDEAKAKLQTLRDKSGELNQQLEQAKSATESSWDNVTRQVKQTSAELQDSVRQTRHWLSKKIAPES